MVHLLRAMIASICLIAVETQHQKDFENVNRRVQDTESETPTSAAVVMALQTVESVIQNDDDLTTLATALEVAGIVGATCTVCNFTALAPVNDAFSALDQDLLQKLLSPSWIVHLQNLLSLHLTLPTADRLLSVDLVNNTVLEMLSGEAVTVTVDDQITFTSETEEGAILISADNIASNGNVQKIDKVLSPDFLNANIFQMTGEVEGYSVMFELLGISGLLGNVPGDFTLLAPTDEAFAELGDEVIDALKVDTDLLAGVLLNHVISGVNPSNVLEDGQELTPLGDLMLKVVIEGSEVRFNNAVVVAADILASNGIAHGISSVILTGIQTGAPSSMPSEFLSTAPSESPTSSPSGEPSGIPSDAPTDAPSGTPNSFPSSAPTSVPSSIPSNSPSSTPSDTPSDAPSDAPSSIPSSSPSGTPSDAPSDSPSDTPSDAPSDSPSDTPSASPSSGKGRKRGKRGKGGKGGKGVIGGKGRGGKGGTNSSKTSKSKTSSG